MKTIRLINDDYLGHFKHLRHACRGIVVKDDKVLLSYETKENKYIIPGGGVEEGESYKECCERELLEETGMVVSAVSNFLDIDELFCDWNHINHYFICELIEDTGVQHLTEAEERAGYTVEWVPLDKAIAIFGEYEKYHATDIANYGLYRREHAALQEYKEQQNKY